MMKRFFLVSFYFLLATFCFAQNSYMDSMRNYIKRYVDNHEVVKGENKNQMHFFDVDPKYRVVARFEKGQAAKWFEMPTSGKIRKVFRVYGTLRFTVNDTVITLNLYQSGGLMGSDEYKDYLFLPFTDATTGIETYESGRYIDLQIKDTKNNQVIVDFNKAYNPYCAYVNGVYNCPIPPRENHLSVAIRAGEKIYGKQ